MYIYSYYGYLYDIHLEFHEISMTSRAIRGTTSRPTSTALSGFCERISASMPQKTTLETMSSMEMISKNVVLLRLSKRPETVKKTAENHTKTIKNHQKTSKTMENEDKNAKTASSGRSWRSRICASCSRGSAAIWCAESFR